MQFKRHSHVKVYCLTHSRLFFSLHEAVFVFHTAQLIWSVSVINCSVLSQSQEEVQDSFPPIKVLKWV